jgi:pimeloyl-ACP methyl ester carboxylesterase
MQLAHKPLFLLSILALAPLFKAAPDQEQLRESTAAATYAPAPCPNPIYGAGFDLGPEFTCGYLSVPENRTRPDSRTIRLAVATRKATAPNPKPDPILFLTGGPGGSGLAEGQGVAKEWHRDRDVIFLDQRGELKSDPFLSCPEIDTFMESTVGLSWSAPKTALQSAATVRTCRDRLASAGADLGAYNTTESATAIYKACAAEPNCHAAFPDGLAEYTRVINDLAANPRIVHVTDPKTRQDATVVIDAYKLSYTVQFATLIGHAPSIPSIVHDLAVGDGTEAALEVLAGRFPPAFNSYGLQWGVVCREMVGRTNPKRVSAAGKHDLPDFPTSVTAMPSMFPWAFTDCAAWDVPAARSQVTKAVKSDVPVLLTSGAFDGTAPPSYAAEAARKLNNSTNLVFPGIGHSASRWAPTCFATIMANFLDQPNGFDDSCLAAQKIPSFLTP